MRRVPDTAGRPGMIMDYPLVFAARAELGWRRSGLTTQTECGTLLGGNHPREVRVATRTPPVVRPVDKEASWLADRLAGDETRPLALTAEEPL
ncbi:hypothetical protein GCM10023405_32880 [Streptomonospora salina]